MTERPGLRPLLLLSLFLSPLSAQAQVRFALPRAAAPALPTALPALPSLSAAPAALPGLPAAPTDKAAAYFKKYPPLPLAPTGRGAASPEAAPEGRRTHTRLGLQAEMFLEAGAPADRFGRLDRQARQELLEEYRKAIETQRISPGALDRLDDDRMLSQTLRAGRELTERHGEQTDWIVGVGRSPVGVVLAAQLADPTPRRFAVVPFSSDFKAFWNKKPDVAPSAGQVAGYRKVLAEHGLDPRSIAERSGKTVFVDYAISGRSISQFLGILSDWADELKLGGDLRGKVRVELLADASWTDLLKKPFLALLPRSLRDKLDRRAAKELVKVEGFDAARRLVGRRLGLSLAHRDFSGAMKAERFQADKWGAKDTAAFAPDSQALARMRFRLLEAKAREDEKAASKRDEPRPANVKKPHPLSRR